MTLHRLTVKKRDEKLKTLEKKIAEMHDTLSFLGEALWGLEVLEDGTVVLRVKRRVTFTK